MTIRIFQNQVHQIIEVYKYQIKYLLKHYFDQTVVHDRPN